MLNLVATFLRDQRGVVELKFSLYGALILSVVVVTADSLLGS